MNNTALKSQEHYELMEQFEQNMRQSKGMRSFRFDKEQKDLWTKGCIYQDGMTNQLFLAYRLGHAYGRASA